MTPDLEQLRALLGAPPRTATPPHWIEHAEAVLGPLPPSYRWWLAEYGSGAVAGAPIATVAPTDHAADSDAVTAVWRRDGNRLCIHLDDGGEHRFALDRPSAEGEWPILRRDPFDGEEDLIADTFAGFLAVHDALARGLRDGPNPTIARLWRTTPGLLRPDGLLLYGPHEIAERNETFEVAQYAPGWTLVGDDSGGRGLLMRHHGRDRHSVYVLDLGALGEDVAEDGDLLTDDLIGWLAAV
ncbi:SMI1/KNR4 family protein [Rhodococcus gannanensis]|uniref:SMI1/KNR4 family protein n=1 Tax=Rhodococcus gannanensis TaxID=1960308 RepID=A0ABW4NYC0_9NOCA